MNGMDTCLGHRNGMLGGFLLFGTPRLGISAILAGCFEGGSFIALSVFIFIVEDIFLRYPDVSNLLRCLSACAWSCFCIFPVWRGGR